MTTRTSDRSTTMHPGLRSVAAIAAPPRTHHAEFLLARGYPGVDQSPRLLTGVSGVHAKELRRASRLLSLPVSYRRRAAGRSTSLNPPKRSRHGLPCFHPAVSRAAIAACVTAITPWHSRPARLPDPRLRPFRRITTRSPPSTAVSRSASAISARETTRSSASGRSTSASGTTSGRRHPRMARTSFGRATAASA